MKIQLNKQNILKTKDVSAYTLWILTLLFESDSGENAKTESHYPKSMEPGTSQACRRALCVVSGRSHGSALRRGGAFATESQLSGRLVGGPDGAWAGTGEGDRGGSRVALRSRRDSRLGSRLVRSCQLSRSKKKAPWA